VSVFPDTNVWIAWLASGGWEARLSSRERRAVHLTSVALQELWAGAQTDEHAAVFRELAEVHRRAQRLHVPPAAAWILSGQVLAWLRGSAQVGGARLRRLRNDALLAATAHLHDADILTSDTEDFTLIQRVLPVRVRVA